MNDEKFSSENPHRYKKPISVMWECTIFCQMNCLHCKANAKKERSPMELSTEEAFQLIDQILEFRKPYPILRITGGDALAREDIFDIIKYAKDNDIEVTIAPSSTNNLNRINLEKLKKVGIDAIALSIDGHEAYLHDSFRGYKGSFEILTKAINIINDLGIPLRLMTTVTKINVNYLPEMFVFVNKLNAEGWYLYLLIPVGRASIKYELEPQEIEDVYNFVYDLINLNVMKVDIIAGGEPFRRVFIMRKLIEMGVLKENVIKFGDLYKYLKKKLLKLVSETNLKKKEIKRVRRKGFGKGIFVAHDGRVYPSSFLPIEIGNIRKARLLDIYNNSEILEKISNPKYLKGKCSLCEFNSICRGCRSRAYAITGDYLAEDPLCIYEPGTISKDINMREFLEKFGITFYTRIY